MEEYKNLIEILTEDKFNDLVKAYIKSKYKADQVWICNGPYDGGRDIVAVCDDREIRINFQVTVQKERIEDKIKKDVKKLEDGCAIGRARSNKLSFFCSHHIPQSKVDDNIRDAELNHSVDLDIYDNFRLAGIAQDYQGMTDILMSIFRNSSGSKRLKLDKNQRLLFDYLATSYDASEIKASFIRVFILFRLLHDGPADVKSIYEGLQETFGKDLDLTFVTGLVGRLKSKGFIQSIDNTFPKKFQITEEHAEVIRKIERQSDIDEATLLEKINSIISKYHISDPVGSVANQIIEFLGGNYDVDPYELGKPRNTGISSERKRIDNLKSVILQNSTAGEEEVLNILNDILQAGKEVPIVEKYAVSKLLMGLYKSDSLDNFLSRLERTVIYDTPVLLQRICLFIDDSLCFDDYMFQTVRLMSKVIDKSEIQIKQYTTDAYLSETVHHFGEAYRLSRFLELPWISELGKSKNVLFNYYLQQVENEAYDTFDDFLIDIFGFTPQNEIHLRKLAFSKFKSILNECGIEIIPFRSYSNFESTRDEYEKILYLNGMSLKNETAIKNDVNAILEINDQALKLESEQGVPLNFITWDNSFFKYRQSLDDNEYWNVVSPKRFADNLSIAKFKVNTEAIANSMLLYLRDNMISQESIGFLDIINELYRGDRIKGTKLLNIIGKLRKRQSDMSENEVTNNRIPIDEFFILLLDYFKKSESTSELYALSNALQDDDMADSFLQIIKDNINKFKDEEGKMKASIIEAFQRIIEPYKTNKEEKIS